MRVLLLLNHPIKVFASTVTLTLTLLFLNLVPHRSWSIQRVRFSDNGRISQNLFKVVSNSVQNFPKTSKTSPSKQTCRGWSGWGLESDLPIVVHGNLFIYAFVDLITLTSQKVFLHSSSTKQHIIEVWSKKICEWGGQMTSLSEVGGGVFVLPFSVA